MISPNSAQGIVHSLNAETPYLQSAIEQLDKISKENQLSKNHPAQKAKKQQLIQYLKTAEELLNYFRQRGILSDDFINYLMSNGISKMPARITQASVEILKRAASIKLLNASLQLGSQIPQASIESIQRIWSNLFKLQINTSSETAINQDIESARSALKELSLLNFQRHLAQSMQAQSILALPKETTELTKETKVAKENPYHLVNDNYSELNSDYQFYLLSNYLSNLITLLSKIKANLEHFKNNTNIVNQEAKVARTDSGMGSYIGTEQAYHEAQKYHAGRAYARELIVLPVLMNLFQQKALRQQNSPLKIVEMGPADGQTSTLRFVNVLGKDVHIDAVEFDDAYRKKLESNIQEQSLTNQISIMQGDNCNIGKYMPIEKNGKDLFVALGAFTDYKDEDNKLSKKESRVKLLKNFKENILNENGTVILEEECRSNKLGRIAGLWQHHGNVILDALFKNKPYLAEMELMALTSGLLGIGDDKETAEGLASTLKEAGFKTQAIKVWPRPNDLVAKQDYSKMRIDSSDDFAKIQTEAIQNVKKLSSLKTWQDYGEFIIGQLQAIGQQAKHPRESFHYYMALKALNDFYIKLKGIKYYSQENTYLQSLKDNLGLEFMKATDISNLTNSKQGLQSCESLKNDQTGGVYVFLGQKKP